MPQETSIPQEPHDGSLTSAQGVFEVSTRSDVPSTIYGAFLVFIAVGATLAIAVSYIPSPSEPETQIAAAAEAQEVPDPFADVQISAKAAYVYDVTAQQELYSQGAERQLPLASIAKVMLALVVSEVLVTDEIVEVSQRAVDRGEGGMAWGEAWWMRDLLDFTLIASSNVGAEALAEAADGRLRAKYPEASTRNAAIWRMNALAQELGLESTVFSNVSGLDLSPTEAGALGSARDVARLFDHALATNPALFAATRRSGESFAPLNYPQRYAANTNNAIAELPGILMGKTGTTDLAGGNLAVAFEHEGHTVVVVVLGATPEGRFPAVTSLVEAARNAVSTAN